MPSFAIQTKALSFNVDGRDNTAPLLDTIDSNIATNGMTVVMGPNGAGKSLFLRLLAGLIKPSAGSIKWFENSEQALRETSIVFQKPILLRRTVKANLEHALAIYGYAKDKIPNALNTLLRQGNLEELAERPARVLSGGEQQRVAIVRALAAKPKILLLDEPSASLDPHATAMIEQLINDTSAQGVKIILATHDQGQAKRLADDILFFQDGKIAEHTPAKSFFKKPNSDAALAYLEGRLLTVKN